MPRPTRPLLLLSTTVLFIAIAAVSARAALDAPVTSTDPQAAVTFRHELTKAGDLLGDKQYVQAEPMFAKLAKEFPQYGRLWESLGLCHYHMKRYPQSADEYLRAVDLGITFPAVALYNAACSQALSGQSAAAMKTLKRSLAAGFENRDHIAQDSDLDSLHDLPDWNEVAGILPPDVQGRVAGWRYDLDFWWKEVLRLHPDPFRKTPEPEFRAKVDELRRRIPDLTDEQILGEFVKLATLLGDGHSGVRPMMLSRVGLKVLPLHLYAFADGLFVIDADEAHADLIGAEVLAVGRRDVDDLWPELSEYVPRDNPMRILQQGPFLLTITAMLRNLGAIDDTETVTLHVRDAGGSERDVEVASGPMAHPDFELIPSKLPDAPKPPLYLEHADEVLWMGPLDGGHALYVEFNVVRDWPGGSIADFAKALRKKLAASPDIDTIVVDVRHNGGGNSFLYPPLVKALIWFEESREDTHLYVLMGRQTFSACQNFVTDLDLWTDAVFVGEPSGSSPNQIGESTFSILPYSHLRAGISSRYHEESYPGDERMWIAPTLPIALDSQDYFANRDPVLEATLADMEAQIRR